MTEPPRFYFVPFNVIYKYSHFQVAKSFEGENDRVKMFLLYCTDDDIAIVRAGSGGLAMLSHEPKIAHKIITVSVFFVYICRVFDQTYQY